ncbi:MAG: hypothetical protein A3E25_11215 [Burkholderiales bacterium RIFCSPHIGHO2_12_FULL_69_20]|nr:MAG: hypothetical protein A3E25_11215 [Burkholderiales bacterium RIFCSPHIGHO2_12_FULL_69_20]
MRWITPAARPGIRPATALAATTLLVALAATAPASVQAQTATAAADASIAVRAFRVQGNTLLDPAMVQATLAPHVGQRRLAELRQAALAVQALYGQAGYAAVVAYLPPQPVSDGTVTIQVVEGRISRVLVQGQRRLSAERVRAALPSLVEGSTPRVRDIDAELQIANENPGRAIGVLLGPGGAPGEVLATVKVDEQPLHRFSVALDNTGNERTGRYRLGLGWQNADFTGHDDLLSLLLQTSPTESSAVKVLSAGYRWPLVRQHAALDLFAAYSDVDGGLQASAAGDLRFAGRGRIVGARTVWYLPRRGEFDQRLTAGLESRAYLNNCSVAGLPAGACGTAGESVAVQPLTLDYAAQTGGPAPAALSVGLAHNLALGGRHGKAADFEAVRAGAKRRYTVLRASGQFSQPVLEDWALAGRFALQHSGDALVPGEQFGLGGAGSVRGYAERELAGDTGVSLSLELGSPRLGAAWLGDRIDLRLLAFVDGGQLRNRGDAPCRNAQVQCTLSSVGVGLRLGWQALQWRLYLAQAQQDAATTQRGDWRTHFSLTASF